MEVFNERMFCKLGKFSPVSSVFLVLAIRTLEATFAEKWSNHRNCSLRIEVDCSSCCLEKRDDGIPRLKQRHSWPVDCQCWGLFYSCSSRPKFNQGWISKVSGRCPKQVAVGCSLEICTNAYLSFPVARIKYPDQTNIREKHCDSPFQVQFIVAGKQGSRNVKQLLALHLHPRSGDKWKCKHVTTQPPSFTCLVQHPRQGWALHTASLSISTAVIKVTLQRPAQGTISQVVLDLDN